MRRAAQRCRRGAIRVIPCAQPGRRRGRYAGHRRAVWQEVSRCCTHRDAAPRRRQGCCSDRAAAGQRPGAAWLPMTIWLSRPPGARCPDAMRSSVPGGDACAAGRWRGRLTDPARGHSDHWPWRLACGAGSATLRVPTARLRGAGETSRAIVRHSSSADPGAQRRDCQCRRRWAMAAALAGQSRCGPRLPSLLAIPLRRCPRPCGRIGGSVQSILLLWCVCLARARRRHHRR